MGTTGAPLGPPFDVPDFTISGALPPYLGTTPTIAAAMSPYGTTLARIAGKICGSDPRKEIFRGLLAYRQALSGIGLQVGFQWLAGSFLEDIESLEARAPNDIDVVTFFHRPAAVADSLLWQPFFASNIALFHPGLVKAAFKCDAFFVDMNTASFNVVSLTRYWFGLFSHRRDGLWKGMLEVPLPVTIDDADASGIVGP